MDLLLLVSENHTRNRDQSRFMAVLAVIRAYDPFLYTTLQTLLLKSSEKVLKIVDFQNFSEFFFRTFQNFSEVL